MTPEAPATVHLREIGTKNRNRIGLQIDIFCELVTKVTSQETCMRTRAEP